MPATFEFTLIDDGAGDFAARGWLDANSLFQQNLRAAGAIWGREIDADAVIAVQVNADNSVTSMSGGSLPGWTLGMANGYNVVEPSALSKIRTGSTPQSHDLLLQVNAAQCVAWYWLDPTPADRNDNNIPSGYTDLVSIVLHEIEHGLADSGYRSRSGPSYGTIPGSYESVFDSLTSVSVAGEPAGAPFFVGTSAMAAFGNQPVPLTYWGAASPEAGSDFYHLATCNNRFDTSIDRRLRYALMSDCQVPTDGTYNEVTPIDRALVRDVGYPVAIFQDAFELHNTDALTHP